MGPGSHWQDRVRTGRIDPILHKQELQSTIHAGQDSNGAGAWAAIRARISSGWPWPSLVLVFTALGHSDPPTGFLLAACRLSATRARKLIDYCAKMTNASKKVRLTSELSGR